jgi:Domain of unknown function (DUF1931)
MIAQRPLDWAEPATHVMGVAKFERLFRRAAGLDVDKQDLRRYSDFINRKVYDLLLRGEAAAKANGRDIIQPSICRSPRDCRKAFTAFANSMKRSS